MAQSGWGAVTTAMLGIGGATPLPMPMATPAVHLDAAAPALGHAELTTQATDALLEEVLAL